MALVDLEELKRLVAEFVALRRENFEKASPRADGWLVYLKGRQVVEMLESPVARDEPETLAFVTQALPVVKADLDKLVQGDAFNRIAVELSAKSELDLAILKRHLASADDKVRFDAVSACAMLDYQAAISVLVAQLEIEEHPFVLSLLTKTVGGLGGVPALKPLQRFLSHEDARVRANALEGLEAVPGDEKFACIMPLLDDPAPRVRANALKAIKDLGFDNFHQLVSRMVQSPKPEFRQSVLFVLKGLRSDFSRDCLIQLVQDRRPDIRRQAIVLLVAKPDAKVWEALVGIAHAPVNESSLREALETLRAAKEASPPELAQEIDGLLTEATLRVKKRREAELIAAAEAAAAAEATPPAATEDAGEWTGKGPDPEVTKKVLSRMNAALSSLDPRERRGVENQIKQGKIVNESQLARVVKRMRDKQKKR